MDKYIQFVALAMKNKWFDEPIEKPKRKYRKLRKQYYEILKKLSQATGISFGSLSRWAHQDTRPSLEAAKKLEKVTGVSRLCWLYPKEFGNPLLKVLELTELAKMDVKKRVKEIEREKEKARLSKQEMYKMIQLEKEKEIRLMRKLRQLKNLAETD